MRAVTHAMCAGKAAQSSERTNVRRITRNRLFGELIYRRDEQLSETSRLKRAAAPSSSIRNDSIWTFVFNVAAMFLAFVTGVIVAKALGPIGKGEYSSLQLMQAAIGAATTGVGASITFYLTNRKRQLSEFVIPLIQLLVIVCILVWAALFVWYWKYGPSLALSIFAAIVPAVVIVSWQIPVYTGLGLIRTLNVQTLALAVLTVVGVSIAVYLGGGTPGAMASWAICVTLASIYVFIDVLRKGKGPGGGDLGELVRFGSRAGLDGIITFLNFRIDSLVLIGLAGAGVFGIYTVAVGAGELLFRVSRAVATASTHRIGSSDRATASATAAKALRLSVAVVAGSGFVLFVVAGWLIDHLYGTSFHGAILALRVLLPGIVVFSAFPVFRTYFAYQLGRPMFTVYWGICMITVQLIACFALVPKFGLMGAAAGQSLTYITAAIGQTVYFCKISGLSPFVVWIPQRGDFEILRRMIPFMRRNEKGGPMVPAPATPIDPSTIQEGT